MNDNSPRENDNLEKRVSALEARNKRVEGDKAWEVSRARLLLISGFTFVVVLFYLRFIEVEDPVKAAVVPTIGFALSTQLLSSFKRQWINRRNSG